METLPTVKIKADNQFGYMIINQDEFDEEVHELYGDEVSEKRIESKSQAKRVAALKEPGEQPKTSI